MENSNTARRVFSDAGLPTQTKRRTGQRTVAQLLHDKPALDDWSHNLERIRQKESDDSEKHNS